MSITREALAVCILTAVAMIPSSTFAQLGETEAAITKRFGQPIGRKQISLPDEFPTANQYSTYRVNGLSIAACFSEGRCVIVRFSHRTCILTFPVVQGLMRTNTQNSEWETIFRGGFEYNDDGTFDSYDYLFRRKDGGSAIYRCSSYGSANLTITTPQAVGSTWKSLWNAEYHTRFKIESSMNLDNVTIGVLSDDDLFDTTATEGIQKQTPTIPVAENQPRTRQPNNATPNNAMNVVNSEGGASSAVKEGGISGKVDSRSRLGYLIAADLVAPLTCLLPAILLQLVFRWVTGSSLKYWRAYCASVCGTWLSSIPAFVVVLFAGEGAPLANMLILEVFAAAIAFFVTGVFFGAYLKTPDGKSIGMGLGLLLVLGEIGIVVVLAIIVAIVIWAFIAPSIPKTL